MYTSSVIGTAILATAAVAEPAASWGQGATWQFEIQDPPLIPADEGTPLVPDADVWDIDLWHAQQNKTMVEALHKRQKTVICYFNLGAVQPQDCDFKTDWYDPGRWIGPWYKEANDNDPEAAYCEKYVNFTNPDIFKLLTQRLDIAAEAGCDGVDPDNIDIANLSLKKPLASEDGVIQAMKDLAAYGKKKGLLVGQKNAPDYAAELVDHLDFAVLENCLTDEKPFCNVFDETYIKAGKPVVDIEYPASLLDAKQEQGCNLKSGISANDRGVICNQMENKVPAKMSEIIKLNDDKYGLNACTQYCNLQKPVLTKFVPENSDPKMGPVNAC